MRQRPFLIFLVILLTTIAVISLQPPPAQAPKSHEVAEATPVAAVPQPEPAQPPPIDLSPAPEPAVPTTPQPAALQDLASNVQGPLEIPVQLPSGNWEVLTLPKWRSLGNGGADSQWTGGFKGQPGSLVVITRWKGAVFGALFGREGSQEIYAAADGELVVHPTHNLQCGNDDEVDADGIAPLLAPSALDDVDHDSSTQHTITVVIGYNSQAASSVGGVATLEAKILSSIEQANESYAYSDIDLRLGLAWLGPIDYYYSVNDSFSEALNHLRYGGDADVQALRDKRDEYGADFASLWLASDVTGGLATVLTSGSSSSLATNIIRARNPISTFIHEMGHNMGCRHLRSSYTGTKSSWYPYSYGNVFTGVDAQKYVTVMCSTGNASDEGATRIPYFSGPNTFYQGSATGVANDTECARTLRQNAETYADYIDQEPMRATLTAYSTWADITLEYSFVGESYTLQYTDDFEDWTAYNTGSADNEGELFYHAPKLANATFYQFVEAP